MLIAYIGVVLFFVLYFSRPEDWIRGAAFIPFEKISGGIAILAFLVGAMQGSVRAFPREIKLLLLLFLQFCLCIPFAIWRGGSFQVVFGDIAKVFVIAIVMFTCVNRLRRLRVLFQIQTLSVFFITVFSLLLHRQDQYGRLTGAIGGVFENPNDLAISLAVTVPLCFILLWESKNIVARGVWLIVLGTLTYGVVQTFSRSGFLALATGLGTCIFLFRKSIRKSSVLVLTGIVVLGTLMVAFTPRYRIRLESIIFQNQLDETGSALERRELAAKSFEVAIAHPLFGVGPGNFTILSGDWHVSHNTFLQLSADDGIPALLIFVALLVCVYRKLRLINRNKSSGPQLQTYALGLRAMLLAYVMAGVFADTAYQFFPYFLVVYGAVLYQIAVRNDYQTNRNPTEVQLTRPAFMAASEPLYGL
jgi:hypothetical protein